MKENLGLIVLDNIKEIGNEVNDYINKFRKNKENYIIPIKLDRFANGEGKVKILETVRDKDIYILTDIGNYDLTYEMHGFLNHMSPDDHFQDIKRVILAMCGHAKKITLVMPLLYESRQHRKKGRESLDCAYGLQELLRMGVKEIITFDVHDPNVCNSTPLLAFENFYPTNIVLEDFIINNKHNLDNLLIVSPDFGAMERARYFAEMLKCDVGVFYKRRDLSKVVNGKNPIIEHAYMGADVKGKDIIVVDDMIASGGSMLEVAKELKEKGAHHVYLSATFALFTEGIEKFEKAFNDGLYDKLYTTNLTYVKNEIKNKEWYHEVNCSKKIAEIINTLNNEESISHLMNGKEEFFKKIEKITK